MYFKTTRLKTVLPRQDYVDTISPSTFNFDTAAGLVFSDVDDWIVELGIGTTTTSSPVSTEDVITEENPKVNDSVTKKSSIDKGKGKEQSRICPEVADNGCEKRFGARVSRDYSRGPGVNAERGRAKTRDDGFVGWQRSISKSPNKGTPKKSHRTPSPISKNTTASRRGKSLTRLSGSRGHEVVGVDEFAIEETSDYGALVSVKFMARLDPLNAVGTDVCKVDDSKGGEHTFLVGKVIAQKHTKGKLAEPQYLVVYADGDKEYIDQHHLVWYERNFSINTSSDRQLKPLIVKMM